jgi:hypothetical protein
MLSVYPIVEGHGEVAAVPILLRRFAYEVFETYEFEVLTPHRLPKDRMNTASHLENAVTLARRKLDQCEGRHAILIVRDADDNCPGQDAPALLTRAERVAGPIPVGVVFAEREYESWFLAAVHSLQGQRGIADDATAPIDPESIRGAKEYLQRHCMVQGATYSPTVDQPALTNRFSFEEARQACRSFNKLWRDLERLFQQEA